MGDISRKLVPLTPSSGHLAQQFGVGFTQQLNRFANQACAKLKMIELAFIKFKKLQVQSNWIEFHFCKFELVFWTVCYLNSNSNWNSSNFQFSADFCTSLWRTSYIETQVTLFSSLPFTILVASDFPFQLTRTDMWYRLESHGAILAQ